VRAAGQAHRKDRTFARLARHRHIAAHHAGELAGDGKAEPRPAVAARGQGIHRPKKLATDFCNKIGTSRTSGDVQLESAKWAIVLQKSQVAGRRIFRENPKQKAIADSYSLTRITEVACEFNVRR
jgi:hypothetical protein